ncbi:MAG: hypothetical protein LBQ66_10510 [Planctomycetaceae bacterium]|jgi:hypothetical protein|nr:hypothetical protein [Planctomycetaceae bacterium]
MFSFIETITLFADDVIERVYDSEELIKLWDEYLHKVCHVKGTVEWVYKRNGVVDVEKKLDIFFDYPFAARETVRKDESGNILRGARAYGKDYNFIIRQSPPQNDQPIKWRIDELLFEPVHKIARGAVFPPLSVNDVPNDPISFGICIYMCKSLSVSGDFGYLPNFAKQDEFKIMSNELITDENGNKFQKIRFTFYTADLGKYPYEVIDEKNPTNIEGEVFLTTKYRLIAKSTTSCRYGKQLREIKHNNFYEEKSDIPLSAAIDIKIDDHDGTPVYEKNYTYKNFEIYHETDHKRFTLSHYGVPEPDLGNSPRRPNYLRYILLVSAIHLILTGAWKLNRLRKK